MLYFNRLQAIITAYFSKLQRPINPQKFIACIDGFRFFAIFTVCLLHLNNYYGRSINYDYYQGVKRNQFV